MKLLSVNLSLPRKVDYNGESIETGIFKHPTSKPVMVREVGLDGDGQADLRYHGGLYKAVYAYPVEHINHWRGLLDRDDLAPGYMGENLTVSGLHEAALHIGDQFRIGKDVVLEVAQPRMPCFKLGLRVGDKGFPKHFLESGRTGFYCSVIEEGEIVSGDPITRIKTVEGGLSVRDIWRLAIVAEEPTEDDERALELESLAPEWRKPILRRLR